MPKSPEEASTGWSSAWQGWWGVGWCMPLGTDKEFELQKTTTGKSFVHFIIKVPAGKKYFYFKVCVWDKRAEHFIRTCEPYSLVTVKGYLEQTKVKLETARQDGSTRLRDWVKIVADAINVLSNEEYMETFRPTTNWDK